MVETCGKPDLAEESRRAERLGQLRLQNLEGDRAGGAEVAGEVDRGHTTASELSLERVAVAQAVEAMMGEAGVHQTAARWR